MAHYPKPFFRPARNLWYVQLDGRQFNLGSDKPAAFKTYHGLMQQRAETKPQQPLSLPGSDRLVVVIVDEFLDWCQKNRAEATYEWYQDRLEAFCKTIAPTLTVDLLKPHHVQKWADEYPAGSRRNLIRSAKRVFNWAEEQGRIERSPLVHMKKPAEGKREQVVSPEQYQALLDSTHDQGFKDLVTVSWETGCRPQESLIVEAKHLDVAGNRWIFPASQSKGKNIPRVVYLTPKAVEISKRLAEKHPEGALFRRSKGKPWNPSAVNCRFGYIKQKVGAKVSLYALRHTWINRMLIGGVDAFTVATLAGHRDPSMLAKHYAHLSQAPGYLSRQAMRAAG
jgi:integrase/recombinase XerC